MKPATLLQSPFLLTTIPECTVGYPVIDGFLCGRVPYNSVTEFFSESCYSKTQLCLQLLVSAQLPLSLSSLSASSLYLYSEFPFPLRYLQQLSLSSFGSSHNFHDHIFVHPLHFANPLFNVLRIAADRFVPS